ncbi:unnamed protein product [Closterium sp. NIES-64]|nr:unnamed protein product [Closterium sp. NIES-65]CAI5991420.1 unnamed protein product [Closterium sp. NIES-64]
MNGWNLCGDLRGEAQRGKRRCCAEKGATAENWESAEVGGGKTREYGGGGMHARRRQVDVAMRVNGMMGGGAGSAEELSLEQMMGVSRWCVLLAVEVGLTTRLAERLGQVEKRKREEERERVREEERRVRYEERGKVREEVRRVRDDRKREEECERLREDERKRSVPHHSPITPPSLPQHSPIAPPSPPHRSHTVAPISLNAAAPASPCNLPLPKLPHSSAPFHLFASPLMCVSGSTWRRFQSDHTEVAIGAVPLITSQYSHYSH